MNTLETTEVIGVLWGSYDNDFDTAEVVTHLMGVDEQDVRDMAAIHISNSKHGFHWFSIVEKPRRVSIESVPKLIVGDT